jgi:tetratricopeptide (TPR) repeat protein
LNSEEDSILKRMIAFALILGLLMVGCATEQGAGDGDAQAEYNKIFRGRWWSYYDRGSFYLAAGQHEAAVADLEKALQGRSTDSWRARTYGLHFVEYFPNRELGIVYSEMGRLEEARAQLEKSLESVDTVRGRHYLDLVKETQIAEGKIQDTVEPTLEISVPPAALLASRTLDFEVKAQDDNGVKEVQVNGEDLYQRGSEVALVQEKKLVLEEGPQEIEVVATDLAGKETVEKVAVVVDLTAPTIGVFTPIEPTVTEDGTVTLEGASVDKNGVSTVNVDKRILAESPGAPRLDFNTELPLGDGENTFIVASKDNAGNECRSAIKVFRGDPESVEAKLWLLEQKHPERLQYALNGTIPLDMLLAVPAPAGNEIRIKSPDTSRPYRNDNTLRISGEVVSPNGIASLTINGHAFDTLTGAPKESFNKRIALAQDSLSDGKGVVKVAIEAKDSAGAVLNKELEVEIAPVLLASKETKMPVAVLAFDGGTVVVEAARQLRSETEGFLAEQKRFRVLERIALQDVLTEQQLSAALSDPNEALSLGKLTPAHRFLVGEVFARGDKGIEVLAKVVNTETGEVEDRLDGFVDDASAPDALKKLGEALATELRMRYPRRSGEILAVAERNGQQIVLVSWTEEDGVREGTRFWILHEDASEELFDEFTDEETSAPDYIEIGQGRIKRLRSSGSEAITEHLIEEGIKLEKGMPAVTM